MILVVTTGVTSSVRLEQRDDFGAFSVSVPSDVAKPDPGALQAALVSTGVGSYDGVHAWILADAVRELATADDAEEGWEEGFQAMLGYARSHDWWDAGLAAVRAHVQVRA